MFKGISKKTKVAMKGDKVKREDSEDDLELLQEKMLAEASLLGINLIVVLKMYARLKCLY